MERKDISQILHENTMIILKLILEWKWQVGKAKCVKKSEDKCECVCCLVLRNGCVRSTKASSLNSKKRSLQFKTSHRKISQKKNLLFCAYYLYESTWQNSIFNGVSKYKVRMLL